MMTLDEALRLFPDAKDCYSDRALVALDSPLRAYATKQYSRATITTIDHVCTEVFYLIACNAVGPRSTRWQDLVAAIERGDNDRAELERTLSLLQSACTHPYLPQRKLGEEYRDTCPDCGFVSYCTRLG